MYLAATCWALASAELTETPSETEEVTAATSDPSKQPNLLDIVLPSLDPVEPAHELELKTDGSIEEDVQNGEIIEMLFTKRQNGTARRRRSARRRNKSYIIFIDLGRSSRRTFSSGYTDLYNNCISVVPSDKVTLFILCFYLMLHIFK